MMYAGFSRQNVNPGAPLPLAGYGNTSSRMHNTILDEITVTAIAFRDDTGKTAVAMTADYSTVPTRYYRDRILPMLAQFGIEKDGFIISATHTHSAPDLGNDDATAYMLTYWDELENAIRSAIAGAIADLKPAALLSGTTQTKGMNFVRHYYREDGTTCGDNYGDFNPSPVARHTTDADPAMHILRCKREGGKDIVIVNWRAHAHKTGGFAKLDCSADFPSPLRKTLEAELSCHAAFFQGASGNINHQSRIAAEKNTTDYELYGRQLAQYVLDVYGELAPCKCGELKITGKDVELDANRDSPEMIAHAAEVRKIWQATNDRKAAVEAGAPYGIHSPYHANAIGGRVDLPDKYCEHVCGFSIGDFAMVAAPNELFDTYTKAVTDASPFRTTMVACLANGYEGYLPSVQAFDYGCYEADCCRCAKGSGERVGGALSDVLAKLNK